VTAARPRKVAIPRLLHVGRDCLGILPPLLREHDFDLTRVLVGCGPGATRALARKVVDGLRADGVDMIEQPGFCGRLGQAATAAGTIIEEGVTLAIGVGGGRALDPVKLAAARTGVDFVSVPTTIAHDGISSPVASLTGKSGGRESHAARMPAGIVVDVVAIASAPAASIRAGAGDLASNLTACMDWRLAHRAGRERYDAFSAMIAESAARPVLELDDLDSSASRELLAQSLLMSGLAMAAAGNSRPCSGAEHLISHALDAQLGPRAALHGEQVALGCLVAAAAHETPLLGTLRASFARLGLPTTPEELGLTPDHLIEAIVAAPAMRPDRWTILSERGGGTDAARELASSAFYAEREPEPGLAP
jgi:glycerol-1-phosphate dehydrogenase [NAD(P)+]